MKDLAGVTRLLMKEKKDVLYSILFGFLAGVAAVGLFASSGYLISKAALTTPLYALIALNALLKLFGITRAASRYAERYFSHRATFTMLSHLRVSFYEKLERLAPSILYKYRSGDLLARIVGDVESLQNYFLRVVYPPFVLALVFLSTIIFTSFYSFYHALILFIGLILTGFVIPALFALRQQRVERNVREGRGELSTEITEFLYGFRELKIYERLTDKKERLRLSADAYSKEQEREGLNRILSHTINLTASLLISWAVLAFGIYLVSSGQLNGLYLAMLMMISLTVFENATPMATVPSHFEESRQAAKRLYSVVRSSTPVETGNEELATLASELPPLLEMERVSFSFPDEERLVLDNVSLRFPAGTKTAIVGPSGSGKSTLLLLLLKIQLAQEGQIQINGMPVEQLSQASIWEHSNVVLQDNHFFLRYTSR